MSESGESKNDFDALIERGQKLVFSLAHEVSKKFNGQFEVDDLAAYGQIGLAQAARDFDPSRATQFTTYSYYRIRGAIYEGLSKLNWTSRAQYNRLRYQQSADAVLELGPHRSDGWAGTSLQEDSHWLTGVTQQLAATSLTTHVTLGDADASIDDSVITPSLLAEGGEIAERLRDLVKELPEEARRLVTAVYFESRTLQDAATELKISKSWASRLHARALQALAVGLRKLGVDSS